MVYSFNDEVLMEVIKLLLQAYHDDIISNLIIRPHEINFTHNGVFHKSFPSTIDSNYKDHMEKLFGTIDI